MSAPRARSVVQSLLHALRHPKDRQRIWIEHRREIVRFAAVAALMGALLAVIVFMRAGTVPAPAETGVQKSGSDASAAAAGNRDPTLLLAAVNGHDSSDLSPANPALQSTDENAAADAAAAVQLANAALDDESANVDLDAAATTEEQQTEAEAEREGEKRDEAPAAPATPLTPITNEAAAEVPAKEEPQQTTPSEEAQSAAIIQLQPIDPTPAEAATPPPPAPPADENRFGAAARSRISRISRVVEQSDLDRQAGAAASSDERASGPVSAGSDPEFDSFEQSALDRWQNTNYTRRAEKYGRSGFINSEGVFVPPTPASDAEGAAGASQLEQGWDRAAMANLTIIWDFGGGGCSGWGLEATNMVLSLAPFVGRIGIVAGFDSWCKGLPAASLDALEAMRTAPMNSWDVDIWVSHKPPQRYPTFPYRGVARIDREPLFVIGRSMTEVHRISRDWASRIARLVDEVWVPARHSLDAFVSGGASPLQLQVIPEPIDAALYDPVSTRPLQVKGLRSFNFLSIFKLEERKGWKHLVRAWMEEFSEDEPVTLTLHTYLFNEADSRNPRRIKMKVRDFVSEELSFSGRNLTARPLPWKNLVIHAREVDTEDMPAFYAAYSAFVLPSHGEGWGMPLMESMAMGLPTISTNWGGQLDFMSSRNSYLIPVERFEDADPQYFDRGAKWAVPSLPALRKAMRHMVAHPDHTLPIAARGRSRVVNKFNSAAVGGVMLRRLQALHPIIVERRRMRAEGRRIVRGSHLATSHAPSPATPAVSEGMMARRGGAVQEASLAAQRQEEALLEAVVADSKRTGWQPEAEAHGEEEQQQEAAAMPAPAMQQQPQELEEQPSNMPTEPQQDQQPGDEPRSQSQQQSEEISMPVISTPPQPTQPAPSDAAQQQADNSAATTDAAQPPNAAIETSAQLQEPAAAATNGVATPAVPAQATESQVAPADPVPEPLGAPVAVAVVTEPDAVDPFSATDPSAPTPAQSAVASVAPTSSVDPAAAAAAAAAAPAVGDVAPQAVDAQTNDWREKLRENLVAVAAAAAQVDPDEDAQTLEGSVTPVNGRAEDANGDGGANVPSEAPFAPASVTPARTDEQVAPSVITNAQSNSQAPVVPAQSPDAQQTQVQAPDAQVPNSDAETEEQSEARLVAAALANKYPATAKKKRNGAAKSSPRKRREKQRRAEEEDEAEVDDAPRNTKPNSRRSARQRARRAAAAAAAAATEVDAETDAGAVDASQDGAVAGRFQPSVRASKSRRRRQRQADDDAAEEGGAAAVVTEPKMRAHKRQRKQQQQQRTQQPRQRKQQQQQQQQQPAASMKARRRQRRRDAQTEN